MRYALVLFLLAFPAAAADEREVFYGLWGTEKQCARAPIKPGGTVLAQPFEVGPVWLRQGQIWCRLNWFPVRSSQDGVSTGAHAQCGEEIARDYHLGMKLSGDVLSLRWGVLLRNGPLTRCAR